MKNNIKIILDLIRIVCSIVFSFRSKAYFLGGTVNRNLGDNAQLICIRDWIKNNYPKHRLIEISVAQASCHVAQVDSFLFSSIIAHVWLHVMQVSQRKGDIVIVNSGYGFIDHHPSWLLCARVAVLCRRTPIIVMPQTVHFMNMWIAMIANRVLSLHPRFLLLCRDFVSLEKAKVSFPQCRVLAFPDIVTSWIGTRHYSNEREGILFCLRKDKEAFYSAQQLNELMQRFGNTRMECLDTTLAIPSNEMSKRRAQLIEHFLEHISRYKVVVTDRYHGTIFALVAHTPVIVIDSNDHKLRSGVEWYPASFSEYVKFAKNLDEAYTLITNMLSAKRQYSPLPTIFKTQYYDRLKELINETL
jgi:exopolysaccharide biosynthesis predicted pyruvyltransferase EpsI